MFLKIDLQIMTYEVVTWPEVQDLMELDGFRENSYLINDTKGLNEFGSSAYFVNTDWLNKHRTKEIYIILNRSHKLSDIECTDSIDYVSEDYESIREKFNECIEFCKETYDHYKWYYGYSLLVYYTNTYPIRSECIQEVDNMPDD